MAEKPMISLGIQTSSMGEPTSGIIQRLCYYQIKEQIHA